MANNSTNKPVNDLIKFWADKQDKKGPEPASRSLRKPLFPNASLPTTPLDGSFFSKAPFGDIPSNSPPSPTKQSQNVHSLITDDNINTTIDVQTIPKKNEEKMGVSPLSQPSKEETSPSTKDSSISRPRDKDLNGKDISNKVGPLPPTRKVTDLVSKFEKVSSPTNSVSTPPKLSRNYQSFPTSPLALSPINRNQLTPEPLLLSSPTSLTLNTKALRRQTVPEPLSISLKQISDEPESISSSPVQPTPPKKDYDPTSISPINPIDHKTTENHVKEVQTQKKQTQEISLNEKELPKLPEQNSNPVIIPSIKRSDSEPLQPSTSPSQSDYLDFLSTTLQNFQTSSFEIASISAPWKSTDESAPKSSQNKNKKISKSIIHSKHLSFGTKKTFTSREITLKNNEPNPSHYETPDLLPQPEPISPIRLDFSDFLLPSNRSSPNLNSNDKQDGEKEKRDFLMSTNQSDIVKPEVPKKDEYSPTTKHMSLKGTVHLIENLKRYLQPNKFKNPNEVNVSAQKVVSQ